MHMWKENMSVAELKRRGLRETAAVRDRLRKKPDLSWLFFELTTRCNLRCAHCGSSCCGEGTDLEPQMVSKALAEGDPDRVMIALTGGEPMLHPQFYKIAERITDAGFCWGMTTNATLIDGAAAKRLKDAGMATVSVSIDGSAPSHDRLRGAAGAWQGAMNGLRALRDAGLSPQVTTVVYRDNLTELDRLYNLLQQEKIASWRIISVEPIGRAKENSGLLLTRDEFVSLMEKIRLLHLTSRMDVSYGCPHYLGPETERTVRNQYFFCGAGITIASIRADGGICACLDIESRPELIQGNIHTDDFMTVWKEKFAFFRRDRTVLSEKCRVCPERGICGGDSAHTWDFDRNEPMICGLEYMGDAGGPA